MKRFVLSALSLSLMLSSMPPMKVFGQTANRLDEQVAHSCETHENFSMIGEVIEDNSGVVSYGDIKENIAASRVNASRSFGSAEEIKFLGEDLWWNVKEAQSTDTSNFTQYQKANLEKVIKTSNEMLKNEGVSKDELVRANREILNVMYGLPLNPLDVFEDRTYSSLRPEYNSPQMIAKIIRDSITDGVYDKETEKLLDMAYKISENNELFKEETFVISRKGKDNALDKNFSTEITHSDPTGLYVIPGQTIEFNLESDKPLQIMLYNSPYTRQSTLITIKPGLTKYTHPYSKPVAGINTSNQYTMEEQKEAPKLTIKGATQFPVYVKGKTNVGELKAYLKEYLEKTSFVHADKGVTVGGDYVNMAQVVSDNIVLITSAAGLYKEIQEIEKEGKTLDEYLEEWDNMIDLYFEYGGYSIDPKDEGKPNYRPRGRAVMHITQKGDGFGGLANHYSVSVTQGTGPRREDGLYSSVIRAAAGNPHWVIWHELAHTFENAEFRLIELTTNLYSLAAQDKLIGRENNRLNKNNSMQKTLKQYHIDKQHGVEQTHTSTKLAMFYQLHNYLGYDWYAKISRAQREDPKFFEGMNTSYDRFVLSIAKIFEVDVVSHFEYYGIKINDEAKELVSKYAKKKIPEKFYLASILPEGENTNEFIPSKELKVHLTHTKDGKTKLEMDMDKPSNSLLAYEIYKNDRLIEITTEDVFIDNDPNGDNYMVIAVDNKYNQVEGTIIGKSTYLSDLQEKSATVGWGSFRKDTAPNGSPITLMNPFGENVVFEKGLGAHTQSEVVYDIEGKGYDKFLAKVGVDRSMKHAPDDQSTVSFEVFVDGEMKYYSGHMSVRQRYDEVDVDITGAKEIKLVTNSIGSNWYDQTVWADAKFIEDETPKEASVKVDKDVTIEIGEEINLLDYIDVIGDENAVATNFTKDNGDININKIGNYTGKVTFSTAGVQKSVDIPVKVVSKKIYLSDLQEKSEKVGWGTFRKDKAPNGSEINLLKESGEELTFEKGLGTHAPSEVVYDIAGKGYDKFSAKIGIDRDYKNKPLDEGIVAFKVYVDDNLAYESGRFEVRDPYKEVNIDLKEDAREIKLVTEALGNNWSDQTVWADAMFTTNESQAEIYADKDIVIKINDDIAIDSFIHAKDRYGNNIYDIDINKNNLDITKAGDYTIFATINEFGTKKVIEVPVKVVAEKVYLSNLDAETVDVGWGNFEKDLSVNRTPITLLTENGNDVIFPKGLGTHAPATIVYDVENKGFNTFFAKAGVDRSMKNAPTGTTKVEFKVYVDNNLAYESGQTDVWQPFKDIRVNIPKNAKKVMLVVESLGSDAADHGVWGDAMFTMNENPVEIYVDENLTVEKGKRIELYDHVTARYKSGEEITWIEIDDSNIKNDVVGDYTATAKIHYNGGMKEIEIPVSVVERKIYLSDITDIENQDSTGDFRINTDIDNDQIELLNARGEETVFEKGLGTYSPSTIEYDITNKDYDTFLAKVGIDSDMKNNQVGKNPVQFKIYVDNELVHTSKKINVSQVFENIKVDIKKGAKKIKLEVDNLGSSIGNHAVWADAMFTSKTTEPVVTMEENLPKQDYLSDLQEKSVYVGWGEFKKDLAVDGSEIDLLSSNGQEVTFEKGLGTHAPATIVYDVKDKGYTKFLAKAGIDRGFKNTARGRTEVEFEVYVDDNLVYESGKTDVWQAFKDINIDITGASTVTLKVDALGSNAADHAVWADAMFTNVEAPQIARFSLPTSSANTEILETEENTEVLDAETNENTEVLEAEINENTEVLETQTNENTEVLETEVNENTEILDSEIEEINDILNSEINENSYI